MTGKRKIEKGRERWNVRDSRPWNSLTVRLILTVIILTLTVMNEAIYRNDFWLFECQEQSEVWQQSAKYWQIFEKKFPRRKIYALSKCHPLYSSPWTAITLNVKLGLVYFGMPAMQVIMDATQLTINIHDVYVTDAYGCSNNYPRPPPPLGRLLLQLNAAQ